MTPDDLKNIEIMKEKIVFIDCDGVILDSEQRMLRKKEERGKII